MVHHQGIVIFFILLVLFSIPFYTISKFYSSTAEAVQSAAYCEVDFAATQLFDKLQVVNRLATSSIRYWNRAPRGKSFHKFLIDTLL